MNNKSRITLIFCIILGVSFLLSLAVPVSAGDSLTVTGELPPQSGLHADFSAAPLSGKSPLMVRFTDQSSGVVISRQWDFNNDGRVDSIAKNPVHIFGSSGDYPVRLRISGPEGMDETIKEDYITVIDHVTPPGARFTQDRRIGFSPLTVKFTDRSQNDPTEYLWTFGDGGTSIEVNPSHTYTRSGFFQVTLTVSNAGGSASASGFVFVLRDMRLF